MPRARARKTTVRKTKSAKKEEKNVENESIVEETVEETMNDTDDQKMENQSEDASIDTDANQIEESEHNGFEVQEEDLKEENKVQEEDDDFDEDEMEIKDEINPSESKNETSSNVSDKSSPTSKKDSRNESRRHRHDSQEKEIKDKDYDESYFKRMHKRAMGKFHDPTDKELFTDNIQKNLKNKEMKLIRYEYSASCIVWLIENIDDLAQTRKLIEKIIPEEIEEKYISNRNVCSVLECIMDLVFKKLTREKDFETENSKWIIKWLDSLAKTVIENINPLLTSATDSGDHILILLIEILGGIRTGRHWNRKKLRFVGGEKINLEEIIKEDFALKEIPPQFKHHLKRLTKIVILDSNDKKIKDIIFTRCTNLSQYLLFILRVRYSELCQMVVKKLIEIVFESDDTRDFICQSASGAYIVEILLLVASESRLSKIWTKHIKSNLKPFWQHEISHFIIQRMIDAIKEANLFTDVSQELFPCLEEVFKCNRPAIGVCLAKACRYHQTLQNEFVTAICKAFDCDSSKNKQIDVVSKILFFEHQFQKPTRNRENNYSIWLYGSLMLQHMFYYAKTYKISKSLLALQPYNLIKICIDRSGSHLIESFLNSSTVELKYKSEFVERSLFETFSGPFWFSNTRQYIETIE
ncbi:hypothetical protein SSS_07911 [Sarcoptes scabiei]|nr:hypothetical protein SSS_07911 [Sarcoptes scabiei]